MKITTSLLLLLWSTFSLLAQNKTITPGALWLDNNGVHINAHGGGMLWHKGKYYWFGEHKADTTNSAWHGVNCYSSKDLYNWKNESRALTVDYTNANSDIYRGCIIERPKVVYNQKTKLFVMWFHLELQNQGYSAARVGMAVADKVTGPYRFVRSYRPNAGHYPLNFAQLPPEKVPQVKDFEKWWTPEWRKAVEGGLFTYRDFEGGQMSRDMTVYVDDDQKAYHIYSSEENLTLHIAELSDDYQSHTGKYIRVAPGGHNEAPAIFKQNNTYYLITSGCTGWAPNAARLLTATNMMGEWTEHPNPCIGKDAELTFNSQSTFIFPVKGKTNRFVFMADRWTPKHPSDGRYVWLPIEFENNLPVLRWKDQWKIH